MPFIEIVCSQVLKLGFGRTYIEELHFSMINITRGHEKQ